MGEEGGKEGEKKLEGFFLGRPFGKTLLLWLFVPCVSVTKTSEHQTTANWLFCLWQVTSKVAQFLKSNHTPNSPNLGAFQP